MNSIPFVSSITALAWVSGKICAYIISTQTVQLQELPLNL